MPAGAPTPVVARTWIRDGPSDTRRLLGDGVGDALDDRGRADDTCDLLDASTVCDVCDVCDARDAYDLFDASTVRRRATASCSLGFISPACFLALHPDGRAVVKSRQLDVLLWFSCAVMSKRLVIQLQGSNVRNS